MPDIASADDHSAVTISSLTQRLSETAPDLIWHYTDQAGFLGILTSGEIWTTDTLFLNDSSEVTYAMSRIERALESKVPKADAVALNMFLSSMDQPFGPRTAVACFCEDGDLLSQWRGYGSPGGYALGFDPRPLLERWMTGQEGMLLPVKYESDSIDEAANRWADTVAEEWSTAVGGDLATLLKGLDTVTDEAVEALAPAVWKFSKSIGHLYWVAAQYKDPSFSEEREWRLITSLEKGDPSTLRTRASNTGLVPYRAVAFQEEPSTSPLRAVRVGPGLDRNQQVAVRGALRANKYRDVEVLSSEVPFRG